MKTTRQKFETKERKKKRELWIQTLYWYFYKKNYFRIEQRFIVSVQRRVSPFDFPILSFPFILFYLFILCWIKCWVFSSTMHGEICAISVETHVSNLFPSKQIFCNWIKVFVCLWNIVFFRYINSWGLLSLPLLLYALFYYFSFSFFPYEDSRFLSLRRFSVLDGNIRGFVNLPSLVFEPTGDDLRAIRKNALLSKMRKYFRRFIFTFPLYYCFCIIPRFQTSFF